MNLDIYRGESVNLTIKIDDNTRLIRQLLGEDIIKSSFNSRSILDITISDYIIYDSINYYVNNLPNVKKNASNSFDYDITFESEYYELLKTQFMDLDANSDFDLVGNLETFITLIVTNMNRIHSGWAKGTCDQTNTDYKLLNFSKSNCMQVLQRLCREFEGEFYFDGKDICFTDKAGEDSGLTFKYKQGLRNIHRTTLSEKNIITRLYAFGSEKNLSSDYRDHSRRLKFVVDGKSYLESNVDKYGTIEFTKIYNDIYPHREGTISSVDGEDITKFFDSGMDFNLNDYLLPGITAKLHFNSGDLGGYELEVSNYDNATKEFTIIIFKDEQGYEMPNATLKPAVGDKYVLLDIKLPQSYIDTAETALQTKAQAYLDDNCEPRVTYILTPDPRYFKTHFIDLEVGDFITIEDTDLGIDVMTRIIELTKSIANQYRYTLKLSDHLEVQLIQRLYSEQEDLKKKIEIDYGGDIIRARRNWKTSEELRTMIFDTDDYFDMGNIRPLSITTEMLSIGINANQFMLKEVTIEGNYTADVSKFHASAGSLIHLTIAEDIRTWTLSENSQNSLVDETPYYIYAKCTKEPGYTGQILVDETARKFDDDATYYYFLIGVLHSVIEGVRGISLTYGQTIINGKFIRTGKIESSDGLTYFDLDNSVIQGKIEFIAGTSGYDNISDKPEVYEIFYQATAPTEMNTGDYWIDSDDNKIHRYNGASWVEVQDDDIATAISDAADAQSTADGKIYVYRQATAPTGMVAGDVGDLWIDTDDNDKLYRWSGSAWAACPQDTADWDKVFGAGKPGDNADITADSAFVTITYPADQTDLQNQIDGKIVSWFTDTDPSGTWEGTDASHAGDMWWNTSTKKLKRYTGSAWSAVIEDQKAIDAYADAATAQDTADGKRRVFVAEPTTPYDIGDLWSAGPSGELKRCKTARASGAYEAGDWELASKYTDDTVADGKAKVFRQATAPTSGMQAGDIWIDTDDGNKPRTYDGADWILMYTIIDGGYITTGSLTADKYNELRNTIVFSGDDSLDSTHPLELDFEIVSEMTAIQNVKLSFRISKFRAYSKAGVAAGTPSGGLDTSGPSGSASGGGSTSGVTSQGHGHIINIVLGGGGENVTFHTGSLRTQTGGEVGMGGATADHTHSTPDHTHPNHTHSTPNHTHPNHSHTAVYGIYEEDTSPTINVYVSNDGINYGDSIGAYTTDQLDIVITGISGAGWKRIKFTSTVRARISAIIMCKIDLSA